MELEQLFCEIDDFCHGFEEVFKSKLISEKPRKRLIKSHLSGSSDLTMLI